MKRCYNIAVGAPFHEVLAAIWLVDFLQHREVRRVPAGGRATTTSMATATAGGWGEGEGCTDGAAHSRRIWSAQERLPGRFATSHSRGARARSSQPTTTPRAPVSACVYTAPTCNECSTCVDRVAQASTSRPSAAFFQRQIMPVAAPSSGQPRPISRLGRAGRPHRPCFRHMVLAIDAGRFPRCVVAAPNHAPGGSCAKSSRHHASS